MATFPNCEWGPPLFLSVCVTLGLSKLKYFFLADFGDCSEGLTLSVLFCGRAFNLVYNRNVQTTYFQYVPQYDLTRQKKQKKH